MAVLCHSGMHEETAVQKGRQGRKDWGERPTFPPVPQKELLEGRRGGWCCWAVS